MKQLTREEKKRIALHQLTNKEYYAINELLKPLGFCLFVSPLRISYFKKKTANYVRVSDEKMCKAVRQQKGTGR